MFKTIVITKSAFLDGEAGCIASYLSRRNADFVHLRKPGASPQEMESLIREIPKEWHGRLVLHDHFGLAEAYGLYGVHLNSRNPLPPPGWTGSVSRSCHSLQEVEEWKGRCDYVSLSPIFDSVSKPGYVSAFTPGEIAEAVARGVIDGRVYALGGVTFARLGEVRAMGFGGAMILGDAWR